MHFITKPWLALDSSCRRYFSLKLLRETRGRLTCSFLSSHLDDSAKVVSVIYSPSVTMRLLQLDSISVWLVFESALREQKNK